MVWRYQRQAVDDVLGVEVPEPVLPGLEARGDRMAGIERVEPGVLGRRRVAAPDVAAGRASTQVEPPAIGCKALDAAGAAG